MQTKLIYSLIILLFLFLSVYYFYPCKECNESYKDKNRNDQNKHYETERELNEIELTDKQKNFIAVNTPSSDSDYVYFNSKTKRNMFNVGKIQPQSPEQISHSSSPTLSSSL